MQRRPEQCGCAPTANASKREGITGNTTFAFDATPPAASHQTVTASYRTVDGTATTADGDYYTASGALSFAPWQTSKTISVTVRGDKRREPNEVFYVDLYDVNPSASLGQGRGTGTIIGRRLTSTSMLSSGLAVA